MDTVTIIGMLAVGCLLALVALLQLRKLSDLTGRAIDQSAVLNRIDWLQARGEQADRTARDEVARTRLEQTALCPGSSQRGGELADWNRRLSSPARWKGLPD